MKSAVAALLLTALFAAAAFCGEAPDAAAPAYKFVGGERVRLIVPVTVGEAIEQIVSVDGWISLPTGGTLNIKSKTIPEAQTLIGEALEKQSGARRVFAALALLELPPRKVFVSGEVKTPQAIIIPAGGTLTLAAALASAGGPTPDADVTRVSVVQETTGQAQILDASRLGQPDNPTLGPVLQPGAVVTVPRGEIFVLAGEVVKPGSYNRRELSIQPGEAATLTRVLFGGGGLKPTANRRDVRVVRTNADGTREVFAVNLDDAIRPSAKSEAKEKSDEAAAEVPKARIDPVLKNGDIIVAAPSGGVAILGKVRLPGVYPLAGDSLKLSRLIAMAGGFADFAKTSSVIVIRAKAPKNPVRVDVGAFSKEGVADKDIDLDDGDLVIVSERLL
ncbi:MAG TPA: SLBB domain-containing protein [Planctomycetota bacterium]|nr:SLBB domain-containing protein [Planctomycetota bacterium]